MCNKSYTLLKISRRVFKKEFPELTSEEKSKCQIYTMTSTNMEFILTCPNGKKIDMSSDILLQMEGKISRCEILTRINFYKYTNND